MAAFFGRRWREKIKSKPFVRKRPKMPSGPWRVAAVSCFAVGALIGWLLFRDAGAAALRVLACGMVGFGVGMYLVETIWERRVTARSKPYSPIGKRR